MNLAPEFDLWAPLDASRSERPNLTVWDGDSYAPWTWSQWRESAHRAGAGLRRLGVRPGDPVACVFVNSPGACAALLGVWLAGGQVISLPLPARGMASAAYADQLRMILTGVRPAVMLTDALLVGALTEMALGVRVEAFQDLDEAASYEPDLPGPDEPAFVQFSSGSTMQPKGCVLTPRAIAAQLHALQQALPVDPERDTGVNWLPMSHDMGLFGCVLLSYWTGHHGVFGTPQRFLRNPASYVEDLHHFGGTLSATPPFALSLVGRHMRGQLTPPLRLRKLVIGGERIDASVLTGFLNDMQGQLSETDLMPSYGLAESVLAVTMTRQGTRPTIKLVDADALAAGEVLDAARHGVEATRTTVLCGSGTPVRGTQVTIRSQSASRVGEIVVQSPCLASGYLDDPLRTAERFTADGLLTGDLGFIDDGQLFVTGRDDDLMAITGRNVYARDIEAAATTVDGIGSGKCAVVDIADGSRPTLVALIERDADHAARVRLARQVRSAAIRQVGVGIDACLFVEAGQLPKTPSGKIQRFRCRTLATEAVGTTAMVEITPTRG